MGGRISKRAGETPPSLQVDGGSVADRTGRGGGGSSSGSGSSGAANGSSSASASNSASSKMQYKAELSSYVAACRLDPEVQSFGTNLQQRMNLVVTTLAEDLEDNALSFGSLKEVTSCFLDVNQEVVKVILECKKDIWNNPELFGLVEEYFDNSLQTLEFCTTLEKCLKRARDSHLVVQLELKRFKEELVAAEAEPEVADGEGKIEYQRTLEELSKFKDAGNPFTEEFFRAFQSVYQQQLLMFEKLRQRQRKLDKKMKKVGTLRKVSSIIFISAVVAILICSVVAAATAAPPVAAALAASASVPLGSMGKWIDSLWKGYEKAIEGQKELVDTMHLRTYVVLKDLDNVRVLVDQLETHIESLLGNIEFALRGEEELKFGVEEIEKKLADFMKGIEDLEAQADRCSRDTWKARTVILRKIINPPE